MPPKKKDKPQIEGNLARILDSIAKRDEKIAQNVRLTQKLVVPSPALDQFNKDVKAFDAKQQKTVVKQLIQQTKSDAQAAKAREHAELKQVLLGVKKKRKK